MDVQIESRLEVFDRTVDQFNAWAQDKGFDALVTFTKDGEPLIETFRDGMNYYATDNLDSFEEFAQIVDEEF